MNYLIYLHGNLLTTISGTEAAYAVYRTVADLADLLGVTADLVDGNTGEVLASTSNED